MNNTNFNEAMSYFFNLLEINELEFNYNEQLNYLISKESFPYDDDDQEYYLVVKLNGNTGTVVVGFSDGIKFYETQTLGQISLENGKWYVL